MKELDNPKRTITIHVINMRSDAADGTIDLRGMQNGGKRTIIDHILGLKHYNGTRNLSENPYKDLGDGMYTVNPKMMRDEMLRHLVSDEYQSTRERHRFVTVHK